MREFSCEHCGKPEDRQAPRACSHCGALMCFNCTETHDANEQNQLSACPVKREEARHDWQALGDRERTVMLIKAVEFTTTPRGSSQADAVGLIRIGLLERCTTRDVFGDEIPGYRRTTRGIACTQYGALIAESTTERKR